MNRNKLKAILEFSKVFIAFLWLYGNIYRMSTPDVLPKDNLKYLIIMAGSFGLMAIIQTIIEFINYKDTESKVSISGIIIILVSIVGFGFILFI